MPQAFVPLSLALAAMVRMKIDSMPKSLYYMRWVFPISILWFLFTAILIPAYKSQVFYFLSISSLFFVVLNVFASWIAGFYLSFKYSDNSGHKLYNLSLALVLNVWGQYFFCKKLDSITTRNLVSVYDFFYLFFLLIVTVVSYMMSVGVGNGS